MSIPHIKTAIPRRRYQYGEFIITILGDVESDDPVRYRYVLAVAQEGNPTPGLYITSVRSTGGYEMQVAMRDGVQSLGHSEDWGDLEMFSREALGIVATLLELTDERPHQLM